MERSNQRTEVFSEGRNVEEALQAACDKLNTTPNQVEYEVIEEGASGGVLGFLKGRVTKIRVWKKSETERKLHELLKGFIQALDMDLNFQMERVDDAFEVELSTEGSDGLLIGRGGETLAALQHLVSRMASHMDETLRVRVDVAGYRKRRQDQLRRKARELADRSVSTGREVPTEPLPADERRVVHLALSEDSRVETRAIGEGLTKRVMIVPVQGRAGRREGGDRREHGERREHGDRREPGERLERGERREESRRESSEHRGGRRASERPVRRPLSGDADEHAEPGEEARSHGRRNIRARGPRRTREERPEPVAAGEEERNQPSGPPKETPSTEEDSYFRIPESIGIVASPSREEGGEPGSPSETEESRPLTFGRRPRADRGRRR
ncbi:MAG: Jag N-terminal domain-containing protein [Candidatus Eisenbacteria bacterium]|nr:Jag N-terminal domain-containing protein [Candidatus Eisenbacteria bacterium]